MRETAETEIIEASNENLYTKELESFSRSILEGEDLEVPMQCAVRAQQIIESAYKSSQIEEVVKINY